MRTFIALSHKSIATEKEAVPMKTRTETETAGPYFQITEKGEQPNGKSL
jgi:hypothetical protein